MPEETEKKPKYVPITDIPKTNTFFQTAIYLTKLGNILIKNRRGEFMKIRGDFVTNSSSVSYVLTMSAEADLVKVFREWMARDTEKRVVFDTLKNFIREGEAVNLCGENVYCRKVRFNTGDVNYREQAEEKLRYEEMSDEELWSYIYGDYILNGEIYKLCAFGATKVETF